MRMTEETEIKNLKAEIESLKKLIKKNNSTDSALERIASYLDQQAEKPRKEHWGNRNLVVFPKGQKKYLTKKQQKIKELVDTLIETKKLSKTASETAMNTFLENSKIRALDRAGRFWAKMYYKQQYLIFPKG